MEKAIRNVTTKLEVVSQEVSGGQGRFYEMHIQPYLTEDKKVDGAVLSLIDITDRKKWENEQKRRTENLEQTVGEQAKKLVDAERLAAIGTTAGMVGHDIRNPLQAIIGDVYLLKDYLAIMPEMQTMKDSVESLDGIEKNVEYIEKIVQDLQDYSRPLPVFVVETDLDKLCSEVIIRKSIPDNIVYSCQVEQGAKKLVADPAMLKRVLSNLVINAVQAMPDGGELDVRAYRELDDVVISVSDTGVGIPQEAREKLFTPLFTTKSKGQGLGLAVVKRLTESLGGTVTFESLEGKRTTFTVRLPSRDKP